MKRCRLKRRLLEAVTGARVETDVNEARSPFREACPFCQAWELRGMSVRSVRIEYLDGSQDQFPAVVMIQCRACGVFLVGSSLMQQLRMIPWGGES